jgi:putative transposase
VIVTDKHRSYGAAHREVMPSVEHRSHKGLNNRAENSHQPTRQRERAMKGFRSTGAAQRFLSAFSRISPYFRPCRRLMTAPDYRAEMIVRFAIWEHVAGAAGQPNHGLSSGSEPRPHHASTHCQTSTHPQRDSAC